MKIADKKQIKKMMSKSMECHRVWHRFYNYLERTFTPELYNSWDYWWLKLEKPKRWKKIWYRKTNEWELSKRLVGYEVMQKIEKWIKRYCPEIKIVTCDDSVYAGSIILLIPHPRHGITIMYIPQCTSIQNEFFLYASHFTNLVSELNKMKKLYPKEDY